MKNIAIICISTGIYNRFWEGFYESINSNFCVESHKNFYFFTDDATLAQSDLPVNVFPHLIQDKGWVLNVMLRSEMFLSIEEQLRQNDFVFNLNSNYRAVAPIHDVELLPDSSHGWLCGLCFDFYLERSPDTFTYDRNPNTQAYIPYGSGKYYFQGGYYGGRTDEFIEMSHQIKAMTDRDIALRLIPRFHDESYVNRYLLERTPKVISTIYATAEQWNPSADAKGIVLDKDKWFSANDIENMKALHAEKSLSFLIEDNLQAQPIGIINLKGGLGNQMFQYALLLQLRNRFPNRRFYLNNSTLPLLECHQGYQLDMIFGVNPDLVAAQEMLEQIFKVPPKYVRHIDEPLFCGYMPIKDSTHPIWIVDGYWQSERYFGNFIKDSLRFDHSKLNYESSQLLEKILNAQRSVSIHVRRGDYVRDIRTYDLMGKICTKEYYKEAVSQFDIDSRYFVFSDDPQWCSHHLDLPGAVYISHNQGADSWQDMALMSACEHQIIANSSFSWWAAWLNANPIKSIIAPPRWFNGIEDKELVPVSWRRIEPQLPEKRYDDLTIVIPVRIDSKERLRNLDFLLNDLTKYHGLQIIILEADIVPRLDDYEGVRRVFVGDTNTMFHRTKYINILTKLADTQYIGIWDSDVIVPEEQFDSSLELLRTGRADMVYPYDGRFYNLYGEVMQSFLESRDEKVLLENHAKHILVYGHHSCGGAFIVNREAYVAAGGENERFKAWGAEDLERFKRWEILGYCVHHTPGAIYHMSHPVGANSRYNNTEARCESIRILLDTCRRI